MVRYNYSEFEEQYKEIIKVAAGRKACTVLILVAFDVDAMASARMLTQQLRRDDITYERVSVMNFDEVKAVVKGSLANEDHDIKTVFLINCGAIYDIPKHFNLEYGSDLRCFIMDHHRPIHLKNVYSRHNVVVFDENYDENYEDDDDIPSEASVMSSEIADDSDDDSLKSDEDEEEVVDEDEMEFDEEEALLKKEKAGKDEEEELRENADDFEFDPDDNPDEANDEEEQDIEENEVAEDEAEEVNDDEERDADETEDKEETLEDEQSIEDIEDQSKDEDENLLEEEVSLANEQPRRIPNTSRVRQLEDDDEEEEQNEDELPEGNEDVDKTFVAGWAPSHPEAEAEGDELDEQEEAALLDRTMNLDNEEEGDDIENNNDDEEDSFRLIGKRKRRQDVDDRKKKKQKIQQYYRRAITHSTPTSLMLLPFIRGKHDNVPLDVIWQSILGITDQFQRGHIPEGAYDDYCQFIKLQFGDHLSNAADRVRYSVQDTSIVNLASTDANQNVGSTLSIAGGQNGHIEEIADYRFYLYRHWSLFESMRHSSYIASRFTIWNAEGKEKFQELFAKMGVPLPQSQQLYPFMKPEFRQQFRNQILAPAIQTKYKLTNPTVTFKSFCRFTRYKNPHAANDIVQAANALLEVYSHDQSITLPSLSLPDGKENSLPDADTTLNLDENNSQATDNQSLKKTSSSRDALYYDTIQSSNKDLFNQVYELLGTKDENLIKQGIQIAIETQQTIAKKAFAMIDGNSIQRFHRIYYAYLFSSKSSKKMNIPISSSGTAHHHNQHLARNNSNPLSSLNNNHAQNVLEKELLFGRPNVLARLGQFIMEVKRNLPKKLGGWSGQYLLPLILLSERQDSTFLVMGISPFSCISNHLEDITDEQKQKLAPLINFKQFFKLAAKDMGIKIRSNSFDPNVIEIHKDDVQDFLGALNNALKKATPTYFNNNSTTLLNEWK